MAPSTIAAVTKVTANGTHTDGSTTGVEADAALAAAISASDARQSYSLRRRAPSASTSTATTPTKATQKRTMRTSTKRSRAPSASTASEADSDSAAASDFSDPDTASDADSDVFTASPSRKSSRSKTASTSTTPKRPRKTTADGTISTPKRAKSSSASPKKPAVSPFDISPRKTVKKPIKVNLEPHEAHPAPAHWETVYSLLARQRTKIVAPVDTMGCEENGREDRRADSDRAPETVEEAGKRERLATLVSLMLSSQTKDPVTAEAVYNLQRTLPNGLCLQSLLEADDEMISGCIAKVGFWRRKTGYLKSAARILTDDFDGDVPRTVDELCSLPGVGPKMAFLALSSMGIQIGIGVDTHVHRLTNRLGWHTTKTPEETRLNLQSWLPHELHGKINRLLVGFGQVICVPVGPRCDLCSVGAAGLCPSKREVDQKSVEKRVKVELLDSDGEMEVQDNWVKVKREGEAKVKVEVELEGPEGSGRMEIGDLLQTDDKGLVKVEQEDVDAEQVDRALEW
ncbi:HhH-GPD domain protein [Kalmanozyma brasiliensis GHG001]|nr:HhH-GPD domain protein [Kalmanozyma brasiliensis GHG001]KAF6766922.1 HhH-GPD domain protein [Kalmanozyma brasiliensis GHG001]